MYDVRAAQVEIESGTELGRLFDRASLTIRWT